MKDCGNTNSVFKTLASSHHTDHERIYGELLKAIGTLIDKKNELQKTFVFKGFGNPNRQPRVSTNEALELQIQSYNE